MTSHRIPVRVWIGLGLALVLGLGSARGDVVVKKNGESIKGRVVRAGSSEVQIEVGDILLRLPRGEVERIEYDKSDDAKQEKEVIAIRDLVNEGKVFGPDGALEKLKDLAPAPGFKENNSALDVARQVADVAFKQLEPQSIGSRDPGAFLLQENELRGPVLEPLWKAAYPGDRYNREFRRRVNRAEGGVLMLRGKAGLEHVPRDLESAKKDMSRAAELLGPQDFLGGAYVDLGTFRWAVYWKLRIWKEQAESGRPTDRVRIPGVSRRKIEDLFYAARVDDPGAGLPRVPLTAELFDNLNYLEKWYRAHTDAFQVRTPVMPTPPPMLDQIWTPLPTSTAIPSPAAGS